MGKKSTILIDVRNQNILKDFRELFNDGLRQEVIYDKLSQKYYLSEQSLSKIVRKQARKINNNQSNDKK